MDKRLTILNRQSSYLHHILHELRDAEIQQDRLRFRHNMERAGEIIAYELSKELTYEPQAVTTPLGSLDIPLLEEQPVLISILRAGLPFHQGFLRLFDRADNGFISAYRHHGKDNTFTIKVEYQAAPSLTRRTLILIDPMLATGRSLVKSYQALQDYGRPNQVFIAAVVGSEEGLSYVQRHIPEARIYLAALDGELTARSYIVPGLGDAGDLAFGEK